MKATDVVFLLPGFFGFDRFASFYYFADRVSAALRGHLEARLETAVPVIPLATGGPADDLVVRQRSFLEAMRTLDKNFSGLERIHLLGHSTGGLDAELLLCRHRLDKKPWGEDGSIRERIASVTTIAAPHYGTTFALADISRFLEDPLGNLSLSGSVIPALSALMAIAPERTSAGTQMLGDVGAVRKFVEQMFYRRQLLKDLIPERMDRLREENPLELDDVPVTCFVTCPLANPTPTSERNNKPDAFFLYLTNHTAGARVKKLSEPVQDNVRRLNEPNVPVIASPSATPRPPHRFDEIDNDAVVNSARQLRPNAKLGAIVLADHADVLGHYDRRDPLHPDRFIKEGVFRSGAQFGDNEFFELYRRIADAVVAAAKPRRPQILPHGPEAASRSSIRRSPQEGSSGITGQRVD